jgi:hypothetical protein
MFGQSVILAAGERQALNREGHAAVACRIGRSSGTTTDPAHGSPYRAAATVVSLGTGNGDPSIFVHVLSNKYTFCFGRVHPAAIHQIACQLVTLRRHSSFYTLDQLVIELGRAG